MSSCGLGVRLVDVTGGDALASFSSSKWDIKVMLRFVLRSNVSFVESVHNEFDCVKIDSLALFVPGVNRNPLPLFVCSDDRSQGSSL